MKSTRVRELLNVAVLGLLGISGAPAVVGAQSLEDMAAPISHPTVFEDPRSTTELRPIYIYHRISNDFITGGGSANIVALQARYAVNERFSIIATKDGYVDLNTDEVLSDQDGWADVGAGVKYAVHLSPEDREIVTVGLRYDFPVGSKDVFQGQGDGTVNPFVSAAVGLGPVNMMMSGGFRMAVDDEDSSFVDLGVHLDTKFGWFHPVLEVNLASVTDAGKRLPIADEGEDFFNFGSTESDGKTLVTGSLGARFDIADDLSLGVAYQIPLTNGEGSNLIDYRITTDLIYRFS